MKLQESIILRQDQEISNILQLRQGLTKLTTEVDLSHTLPTLERSGILIALLSDIHAEEIVDPRKVMQLNKFNPEICKKRVQTFFYLLWKELGRLRKEVKIDELHLLLGGDNISNSIHYELAETNAMPPMHALLFVQELLVSGIRFLAEKANLKTLRVLCVTGNHPRTTSRITFKTRTGNSLEYMMYKEIEHFFQGASTGYDNVVFEVAEGAFIKVNVFGKTYTLCHGDQFTYVGGIGGIMIPAMRWHLQFSKAIPADKRFIGNWHQWIPQNDITINGSVIGYNEFPMGKGLPFQPPIQHVELLDSVYGFTKKIPLILG